MRMNLIFIGMLGLMGACLGQLSGLSSHQRSKGRANLPGYLQLLFRRVPELLAEEAQKFLGDSAWEDDSLVFRGDSSCQNGTIKGVNSWQCGQFWEVCVKSCPNDKECEIVCTKKVKKESVNSDLTSQTHPDLGKTLTDQSGVSRGDSTSTVEVRTPNQTITISSVNKTSPPLLRPSDQNLPQNNLTSFNNNQTQSMKTPNDYVKTSTNAVDGASKTGTTDLGKVEEPQPIAPFVDGPLKTNPDTTEDVIKHKEESDQKILAEKKKNELKSGGLFD